MRRHNLPGRNGAESLPLNKFKAANPGLATTGTGVIRAPVMSKMKPSEAQARNTDQAGIDQDRLRTHRDGYQHCQSFVA